MKKILSAILAVTVFMWGTLAVYAEFNYVVTARALNIRQEPNTNCAILATVPYGTNLKGIQPIGGWTQIDWNGLTAYVSSSYIKQKIEPDHTAQTTQIIYTPEDLDLLARVINSEAGSSWLSDEHQLAVGSVVLNRVADSRFPNTLKGVVYQRGQYACVWSGMINRTPSERAINNAKYLLENGVTIPTNVVWQAQFRQGVGLWKYIEGHYFCY